MKSPIDELIKKLEMYRAVMQEYPVDKKLEELDHEDIQANEDLKHWIEAIYKISMDIRSIHHELKLTKGSAQVKLNDRDRGTIKDLHDKVRIIDELYEGIGLFNEIMRHVDIQKIRHDPHERTILNTFNISLDQLYDFLERNEYDVESDFEFKKTESLLESNWFMPDAWLANISDLPDLILPASIVLPKGLRKRLEAAYAAYIFGIWLAVISMSRATLEFALKDRADQFGIKLNDNNLVDLCNLYQRHFPELEQDLKYIRKSGNAILHPKVNQKIIEYPQSQQTARKVLRSLSSVMEAIYA